jgi:type IV fimbrial biogenesis protein FimT
VLTLAKRQGGFTLIEVLIAVIIIGILFSVAAPSFTAMVQNSKIRTTTDAILNGLQLARAEGVSRNAVVRFQLTDSLTNGCALSTSTSNWVISLNDPTAKCANAPASPPPGSSAAASPASPYIIQSRPSTEGSTNVTVAGTILNFNGTASADVFTGLVTFNGMGKRLTPVTTGNTNVVISISNPAGGLCAAAGGPMRCLNVIVTSGGQVRMCNPALPATNSQGC